MPTPVAPEQLYSRCDLSGQHFDTTDELEDFAGLLGQARAAEAVDFGLSIQHEGFNLYVMGPADRYVRHQPGKAAPRNLT